jgi:hypothetical protein
MTDNLLQTIVPEVIRKQIHQYQTKAIQALKYGKLKVRLRHK